MLTILYTALAVSIILALMSLALLFANRGRSRRCACSESRKVARILEERKKAAKAARRYSPESVDPNCLPIIDTDTVK